MVVPLRLRKRRYDKVLAENDGVKSASALAEDIPQSGFRTVEPSFRGEPVVGEQLLQIFRIEKLHVPRRIEYVPIVDILGHQITIYIWCCYVYIPIFTYTIWQQFHIFI